MSKHNSISKFVILDLNRLKCKVWYSKVRTQVNVKFNISLILKFKELDWNAITKLCSSYARSSMFTAYESWENLLLICVGNSTAKIMLWIFFFSFSHEINAPNDLCFWFSLCWFIITVTIYCFSLFLFKLEV